MEMFKPPETLRLDGDMSVNWEKFIQQFTLYLTAIDGNDKPGVRSIMTRDTTRVTTRYVLFSTRSQTRLAGCAPPLQRSAARLARRVHPRMHCVASSTNLSKAVAQNTSALK